MAWGNTSASGGTLEEVEAHDQEDLEHEGNKTFHLIAAVSFLPAWSSLAQQNYIYLFIYSSFQINAQSNVSEEIQRRRGSEVAVRFQDRGTFSSLFTHI